ncbi:hypothetical protein CVT26_010184 [Gymnopilus dilepis]|uniref:NAD(P)-binding protein n=1 Tax=Gymnopilus dilepis TaxID=231916 RepID=A0A409W4R4_9AGAR|nr:hypothetical protein CVT26_010184 [Gymnopilus dilepis]
MGLIFSIFNEGFPPKSRFTIDDIPDLTGKVIIVTGANSGIGKETAKALLAHNAKVYIAARIQEKVEAAIQELMDETGNEAIFLKLDLSDLKSVKAAAEEFLSKEKELHVLFNNAGVMNPPIEELTAQGYDLCFGTNALGHFYFTKLLLPALLAGAKSSPDGKARVVNTSSSVHRFTNNIDFNTLRDSPARRRKWRWILYAQSKLGNVFFSNELARRYGDQGIVSTSLNPGNLKSDLLRHLNKVELWLLDLVLHPVPYGAITQLWAGTSPEGLDLNGKVRDYRSRSTYWFMKTGIAVPNPLGSYWETKFSGQRFTISTRLVGLVRGASTEYIGLRDRVVQPEEAELSSKMGVVQSFFAESFPPKSKFSPDNIPDLSGKVIIVTGANTGQYRVGKATAKALLAHNAKVYLAARSQEKAEQAIKELKEQTGKEGIFLKLDLADLKSIKSAAEEFQSKEKELHVLFNNAGVMAPPIDQLTAQGYDLQFGTNVLGHFYFTKLLLPSLIAGAKSSPDGKARVVNTSSFASRLTNDLDFNALTDTPARRKKGSQMMYIQSKFGNVLFSNELARRYGDQGIVSTAVNPGNLRSDLQRHISVIELLLLKPILYPAHYGALTQLWAGTSPEGAELNGKFLIPWARVGVANPATEDPKLAGDATTMSGLHTFFVETFPPASKFSTDDIPDLSGKVIIVTGANTGVGKETAKALLAHNAKVYLAARSQEKTEQAIKELKEETGKEGIFLHLDLADLNKEKELHVLFNNAGVMMPPIDQLTAQGYDLQFGTNVLGHFYFTKLLLPSLIAGAKASPDGKSRVVNTTAFVSHVTDKIDFQTVTDTPARRKKGTQALYAQSKFANVVYSNEFARRYADQGVISIAANPGSLRTDLQRHTGSFVKCLVSPLLKPAPAGALTQLWAGTSAEGANMNGKYLIPWARVGVANPAAEDPKCGEDLWKWLEEQVQNV